MAFRTAELCFVELCGEPLRDRARTLMPTDLADAYRYGQLLAASWYPIEWYTAALTAFRKAKGVGPELAREIGRLSARHDMNSVYKQLLLKLVSPQALIGMSQRLFSSYYDTGAVETESRKGYVHVKCRNCLGWDENMWAEFAGSCEVLLELAGAKHVRLRVLSGGRNGDSQCELEAHWA